MKRLTCEMCGSTDLLKQDGVFVCQSCGCKYTIEEARKMMIEGTVDVSGSTVKVDSSQDLTNLYTLARRAKDQQNDANAAKYYDLILMKDPLSWEANFYAVYYKAMTCNIAGIATAAQNIENCIESTFSLIDDTISESNKKREAIKEVRFDAIRISYLLQTSARAHYNDIDVSIRDKYTREWLNRQLHAKRIIDALYINLVKFFADDETIMNPYGINMLKECIDENLLESRRDEFIKIIERYEPDYSKSKMYALAKEHMETSKTEQNYLAAKALFQELGDYKDSKELADRCIVLSDECRKEAIYKSALEKIKTKNVKEYENAIQSLTKIKEYKDSAAQIARFEGLKEEAIRKIERSDKSFKAIKISLIVFFVVAAVIIAGGTIHKTIIKNFWVNEYSGVYANVNSYNPPQDNAIQISSVQGELKIKVGNYSNEFHESIRYDLNMKNEIEIKKISKEEIVFIEHRTWDSMWGKTYGDYEYSFNIKTMELKSPQTGVGRLSIRTEKVE